MDEKVAFFEDAWSPGTITDRALTNISNSSKYVYKIKGEYQVFTGVTWDRIRSKEASAIVISSFKGDGVGNCKHSFFALSYTNNA